MMIVCPSATKGRSGRRVRWPTSRCHCGSRTAYGHCAPGAIALGVDVIEPDCWLTRDAALVCLHDARVDRTTDGSGNTAELTLPDAEVLHVDAGTWFAAAWPNTLRVPTLTDVVDELGGRAVLCPEAKNADAGRAIVEPAEPVRPSRHGDWAVVHAGRARPRGSSRRRCHDDDRYLVLRSRPAARFGYPLSGFAGGAAPSLVSPATAVGLDVVVWVVNRRVDAAPWLATSAIGFFFDDPLYLSGRSPVLASDRFAQCTYYYCHLASSPATAEPSPNRTRGATPTSSPSYRGRASGAGAALSNAPRPTAAAPRSPCASTRQQPKKAEPEPSSAQPATGLSTTPVSTSRGWAATTFSCASPEPRTAHRRSSHLDARFTRHDPPFEPDPPTGRAAHRSRPAPGSPIPETVSRQRPPLPWQTRDIEADTCI